MPFSGCQQQQYDPPPSSSAPPIWERGSGKPAGGGGWAAASTHTAPRLSTDAPSRRLSWKAWGTNTHTHTQGLKHRGGCNTKSTWVTQQCMAVRRHDLGTEWVDQNCVVQWKHQSIWNKASDIRFAVDIASEPKKRQYKPDHIKKKRKKKSVLWVCVGK